MDSESDDLVTLFTRINLDPKTYKSFPRRALHSESQDDEGSDPEVKIREDAPAFPATDRIPLPEESWNALDSMWERSRAAPPAGFKGNRTAAARNVALTSACSGVGATSIAASLARISSRAGEPTHIVTCSSDGLLPLHFGVTGIGSAELVVIPNYDRDSGRVEIHSPGENRSPEAIKAWIGQVFERDKSRSFRLVFDLGPIQSAHTPPTSADVSHLLILIPDIRCLSVLERWRGEQSFSFLLNQFDSSNPLHLQIQKKLNSQFPQNVGPRPIRRDRNVGIALAHGSTILDYAPKSAAADDLLALDEWLQSRVATSSPQTFRATQGG